mmetsp:Transcript_17970/g.36266  ORF Transcript_17970/g.36266 Transcript_17970/m.36266 type:complete len:188 (-) Transcript_17970:502-1065(-)
MLGQTPNLIPKILTLTLSPRPQTFTPAAYRSVGVCRLGSCHILFHVCVYVCVCVCACVAVVCVCGCVYYHPSSQTEEADTVYVDEDDEDESGWCYSFWCCLCKWRRSKKWKVKRGKKRQDWEDLDEIEFEAFTKRAKTGDILLFSTRGQVDCFRRRRSHYDHVGIVVELGNDQVRETVVVVSQPCLP